MLITLASIAVVAQVAIVDAAVVSRIGSIDGDPPTVFGRVVDLATNPAGQVFVLDAQASEVRVFSAEGEHLFSFGREGEGPGEFNRPVSISVNGGEVLVQNTGGLGSRFSESGDFIDASQYGFGIRSTARLGQDLVVLHQSGSVSLQRSEPLEMLLVYRSAGRDTLWSGPSADLLVRTEAGAGAFTSPFCGLVHYGVTPDGSLVVADGLKGALVVYEVDADGAPRRGTDVQVTTPAAPLSDGDYEILLARIPERFLARRDELQTSEVRSSLCGVEISSAGLVWVRLLDRADREVWIAHDTELHPVQGLAIPEGVEVMAISSTHMFGIWRDEFGVQYVAVLKVPGSDDF